MTQTNERAGDVEIVPIIETPMPALYLAGWFKTEPPLPVIEL